MRKKSITKLFFVLLTLGCLSCDSLTSRLNSITDETEEESVGPSQDMNVLLEISVPVGEDVKSTTEKTINVLKSRLNGVGIARPNIQKTDTAGRIRIEMKGVKEPERILKLIESPGVLEFWETAEAGELIPQIVAVNDMAKEMEEQSPAQEEKPKAKVEPKAEEKPIAQTAMDSIFEKLKESEEESNSYQEVDIEEYKKSNPLFAILLINTQIQTGGPVIGMAEEKDTAKISEYFRIAKEKNLFPSFIYPTWTSKIESRVEKGSYYFELIALASNSGNGKAALNGDVITKAEAERGYQDKDYCINLEMDLKGAEAWARLTKKNVDKTIAIVFDGHVYSYPRVNQEITGGRSQITGNFTKKEAKDLANILMSGQLPAHVKIIQK